MSVRCRLQAQLQATSRLVTLACSIHRWTALVGILSLATGIPLAHTSAQEPRKSQHATLTQQVAGTLITIAYNRPVARGRNLFGALVPYDKPWTPGADSATLITFSTDVKVNGSALTAGTYSLWAIPRAESWTIIFSSAHPVFHIPYPTGRDVLRVETKPAAAPHMETLAFYFPVVDARHAELAIQWGPVSAPLTIDVP